MNLTSTIEMAITEADSLGDEAVEKLRLGSPHAEADERHLMTATQKNGGRRHG